MDIVEALFAILFAAGDPLETSRLSEALCLPMEETEAALNELRDKLSFARSGVRLSRMDNKWQLTIAPDYAAVVRRCLETRKPASLSQSLLETLAIFAYRGPCTRGLVEKIRGVDSGYATAALRDRGYIEEAGRLEAPGTPILYRLAPDAFRLLGIESIADLPPLPDDITLPEETADSAEGSEQEEKAQEEMSEAPAGAV